MNAVCVFCGSSVGRQPGYAECARTLGRELAARELTLVYGGGNVGLMGELADAALAGGGRVIGVIPEFLVARELAHPGISVLHQTPSMHARKTKMFALADACVAIPGGLGTLDELIEVWTWASLALHAKPFGLLNVNGYFDPLLGFLDRAVREGFVSEPNRALPLLEREAGTLLDRLALLAGAAPTAAAPPAR